MQLHYFLQDAKAPIKIKFISSSLTDARFGVVGQFLAVWTEAGAAGERGLALVLAAESRTAGVRAGGFLVRSVRAVPFTITELRFGNTPAHTHQQPDT
jgi:hypothetical protein